MQSLEKVSTPLLHDLSVEIFISQRNSAIYLLEACYRWAQTFKQPNIQIFKHLRVLGQT
jgi:hypothetical protein